MSTHLLPGKTKDTVSVTIRDLRIDGFTSALGVANYLGIPYAEIPARFRQAKPLDPHRSSGVVDATWFGPRCPQPPDLPRERRDHLYRGITPASEIPMSEFQCLKLNIYAPPPSAASPGNLPVFVWIHGGGWTIGDGNSEYDGNFLVQESIRVGKPIIYVSINYRLGYFGFLTSKELRAEALHNGDVVSVNQGLYDQRLALQWVQNNIHYFGGDGSNVTLAGESAGAWSVLAHITSNVPVCKRALIMSAPAWQFGSLENDQETFDRLVESTGVQPSAPDSEKLAALRDLSHDQLAALLHGGFVKPAWDPDWFVYHDQSQPLERLDRFPPWVSSVVVGWTKHEAVLFGLSWQDWTSKQITVLVRSMIPNPDFAKEVMDTYGISESASQQSAVSGLYQYVSESVFGSVPYSIADVTSTPVSVYRFDQVDEYEKSVYNGYSYHVLDIVYFCRLPGVAGPDGTESTRATADAQSKAWLELIHGSQPWQPFSSSKSIMSFNGTKSGATDWPELERLRKFTSTKEREQMYKQTGFALLGIKVYPADLLASEAVYPSIP